MGSEQPNWTGGGLSGKKYLDPDSLNSDPDPDASIVNEKILFFRIIKNAIYSSTKDFRAASSLPKKVKLLNMKSGSGSETL